APPVQELLKKVVPLQINAKPPVPVPADVEFVKGLVKKVRAFGEKIRGVPATVLVDAEWTVLGFISGYKSADAYATDLNKIVEPYAEYAELRKKIQAGEPDYKTLYAFLKSCHALKKKAEIRTYGEKAINMEKGEHHGEIAFFLAKALGPDDPQYGTYRTMAISLDPENKMGFLDEFVVDDALRILEASSKNKEEQAARLEKGKKILEDRIARESPPLHPEKGQVIYFVLYQVYRTTDLKKAMAMLEKAIEMAPHTSLAKGMTDILKRLGKKK
ncbi:MAG: hypothetical protein ACYTHN_05580, partial [Planctomycetota bacterium]